MSTVRFDQLSQPLKIPCSKSHGRPKPCLKPLLMPEHDPLPFSEYPIHSPHVHFPPTPTLTSTIFTHSAVQYDRAPIVVAENVCALPERGGRCYNTQLRNKRSSSRVRGRSRPPLGVDDDGVKIEPSENRLLNPPGLISNYSHPPAHDVCESERRMRDQHAQYNPYFASYSSSSSSSSSESESDLELSYSSVSPPIPRAAVDSFSLSDSPSSSTYPSESSLVSHQHGFQQFSYLSISRPSHQQSQPLPQNLSNSSLPSSREFGQKRSIIPGGRRKGQEATDNMAARLAKFGGGFSAQSMVLEGCLGGF